MKRICAGVLTGYMWLATVLAGETTGSAELRRFADRQPETMRSQRWRGVVRQTFDYSCGSGSIANLLALTGRTPPTEQTLIDGYAKLRGPEVMQEAMRNGFSLLDLKIMMGSLGYKMAGVRYEAGTLPEDPQPMIVYLVVKGYRHFSVFAGTEQGQIVLLDPARGRIRITVERFLSEWDGSALCFSTDELQPSLPPDDGEITRAQDAARSTLFRRP